MGIGAGIVGVGFIGLAHIEAIRRLGFVEILALSDANYDMAASTAAKFGIPNTYQNYREMLLDPRIDVVHICTPNHLHFDISKAAILAGKHVLSEKPLALNRVESEELLRLAEEHSVVHAVNFNYRHFPMVQQLWAMIQHGQLGEIRLVHGNYLQDWLLYDTDFNWRILPEYGGVSRAIADIGSHWISTVEHVIGEPVVEVLADVATLLPIRKRTAEAAQTFNSSIQSRDYQEISITTEDFAALLWSTAVWLLPRGTRNMQKPCGSGTVIDQMRSSPQIRLSCCLKPVNSFITLAGIVRAGPME